MGHDCDRSRIGSVVRVDIAQLGAEAAAPWWHRMGCSEHAVVGVGRCRQNDSSGWMPQPWTELRVATGPTELKKSPAVRIILQDTMAPCMCRGAHRHESAELAPGVPAASHHPVSSLVTRSGMQHAVFLHTSRLSGFKMDFAPDDGTENANQW